MEVILKSVILGVESKGTADRCVHAAWPGFFLKMRKVGKGGIVPACIFEVTLVYPYSAQQQLVDQEEPAEYQDRKNRPL